MTVKINERTKAGKMLKELIELFSKENKGVEIVADKSPYNADFVAKIRRAEKQKSIRIDANNVWESLGLK